MAKHEMYVADFYMKRGAYLAALGRAKYVIEHIPNTPQTPFALSVLVEAYEKLDYQELKQSNLEVLKSNFPEFAIKVDAATGKRSWVNVISLGVFGDNGIPAPDA